MAGVLQASPSPLGSFHKKPPNKKCPCSPMGNKDRKYISAVPPCLPEIPTTLATVPTHRLPLTQAIRQQILGDEPFSLCPRRPICCSAFRSALSCRNSLWMRYAVLLPLPRFFILLPYLTTQLSVCQELFSTTGGNGCYQNRSVVRYS